MLRHVKFFGDANGVRHFMKLHADILRPKFDICLEKLDVLLGDTGSATWTKPLGGYFISLDVPEGCAKKTVALAKQGSAMSRTRMCALPV